MSNLTLIALLMQWWLVAPIVWFTGELNRVYAARERGTG